MTPSTQYWGKLDRVPDVMRAVCKDVIIPGFEARLRLEHWTKHDDQPVTTVDVSSEAYLRDHLCALLPRSRFVGEETSHSEDILSDRTITDPIWLVDPLDGTRAFLLGLPRFGVIVALLEGGEAIAGWLYEPLTDRFAVCARGNGVRVNGRVVDVPAAPDLSAAWSCKIGTRSSERLGRALMAAFPAAAIEIEPMSSCSDYLDLLTDECSVMMYSEPRPWDHFAGSLMHRERNGTSCVVVNEGVPMLLHAPNRKTADLVIEACNFATCASRAGGAPS